MARSTCVYAVMHPAQVPPLATFTVKRELRSLLERLADESPSVLRGLVVYRMSDGPGGMVAAMDTKEILDQPAAAKSAPSAAGKKE